MFASLGNSSKAEEHFKSSIKVFEEIRDLQKKMNGKSVFTKDMKFINSSLWCPLVAKGKITEALFTVERGRAQALRDLMESNYGVKSAPSSSEDRIERMSRISGHNSSSTIFLAENYETFNFWVLLKGQQYQFVRKKHNQTLTSLKNETYKNKLA